MFSWRNSVACIGMMGLVLWLGACSTTPSVDPSPHRQSSAVEHEDIFAVGFRSISERYIDPVSVGEIAMHGLQGFAALDPAIHIKHNGKNVDLTINGEQIRRLPTPGADDGRAWAEIATQLVETTKQHSELMRKASDEKLYEAVFDGTLSDLDVFSRYAGATEARRNRARRDGFGGIGIRFKIKDDKPVITSVMADTPAQSVGLRIGDQITHIDGQRLETPKVRDIVDKLRGPTQSEVRVGLHRPSEDRQFDVVMERQHIVPPSVKASIDSGIVTLKISGFNQATARDVANQLSEAKSTAGRPLKGLIVDLRGNPGGLLKQSVKIADLLLTHGHIVSTRGRHPDSLHHYEAGGRDVAGGLPIVVVVDGKSASASEIVAAALQDRGRAVLVGTSSFGKGTVQAVIRLPNDGEVTLTWSRLIAPSGYALHGLGVRPGVCTSGKSKNLDAIVESALAQRLKLRSMFAAWRTSEITEKEARKQLRASCPPERRRTDLELKVARRLVENQTFYIQALDLSSATSQARN